MKKRNMHRGSDGIGNGTIVLDIARDEETALSALRNNKVKAQTIARSERAERLHQRLVSAPCPPGTFRASNGVTLAVSASVELRSIPSDPQGA